MLKADTLVDIHTFQTYLWECKSAYQEIVAFSGEDAYGGAKVSEASFNGFVSGDIARKIRTDPYRFLICADQFPSGHHEPLLHATYVDKLLAGINVVQPLSRPHRGQRQKHNCFVLDFQNNSEAIPFTFQDCCRTMPLARRDRSEQVARPSWTRTHLQHIGDDIVPNLAADAALPNAKANTPHTARLAHDQVLVKAAQGSMKDFTLFYKQFVENESFMRFVGDMVFAFTNP